MSPGGSAPKLPKTPFPGGPSSNPTPNSDAAEAAADPADWEVWWRFNGEALLDLRRRLDRQTAWSSGGDGFYSAGGERQTANLTEEDIKGRVMPSLHTALRAGGSTELLRGALISLARLERAHGPVGSMQVRDYALHYLKQDHQASREAGLVALGIRADEAALEVLAEILMDTESGREMLDADRIGFRDRSLAAYALGMLGMQSEALELRTQAVDTLIYSLEHGATMPYDVQVASLVSLGLIPLEACRYESIEDMPPAEERHICRSSQLSFLRGYFANRDNHSRLRAYCAVPMGRIASNAVPENRRLVAETLLASLEDKKAPKDLRQSAVLALGLFGDSDDDELDTRIRESLTKVANRGGQLEKRFALVSLAKVGGRPGTGEGDGDHEVERFLSSALARGKRDAKPWAALSLGVYAHTRFAHKQTASDDIAESLRQSLRLARDPQLVSACSLALGLLADGDSTELVSRKLAKAEEPSTRGFAALGLGLADADEAAEQIEALLSGDQVHPETLLAGATALRLMGSREIVPELTERLTGALGEEGQEERAALLTSALGMVGDGRAALPLCELLLDTDATPILRGSAARALGDLCDNSPAPWSSMISADINYSILTSTLMSYSGNGSGLLELR